MIGVIKRDELADWLKYKTSQEFEGNIQYRSGYMDALENLSRDILEGRVSTHLFTGTEEESVVL